MFITMIKAQRRVYNWNGIGGLNDQTTAYSMFLKKD